MSVDTEIVLDEKISIDIREPRKYKVIMLNDDSTPMSLLLIFYKRFLDIIIILQQK
jgi:ATP-dependent Clp protease adapter protein ClpS